MNMAWTVKLVSDPGPAHLLLCNKMGLLCLRRRRLGLDGRWYHAALDECCFRYAVLFLAMTAIS